jgi:hypothetical protein
MPRCRGTSIQADVGVQVLVNSLGTRAPVITAVRRLANLEPGDQRITPLVGLFD